MSLPNCYRCGCQPCECADGITLYHADCRDVLPLLGTVDLVLTDPPYGIALEEHGRNGYQWNIRGDSDQSLGVAVLKMVEPLPCIVFAGPKRPWPGEWRQFLVWDKGPTVGGGGDRTTCWKYSWELIQVRRTGELTGKREEAVLRFHVTQRDYHFHPAQKPTALLRYFLDKTGATVTLDPFAGSGTTGRACKDLGRKCIMVEIEEKYCEIAANRLRQEVLFA